MFVEVITKISESVFAVERFPLYPIPVEELGVKPKIQFDYIPKYNPASVSSVLIAYK